MPKQIIDYSKNIIYKLVCNDLNVKDIYVGHTTNFIKRKQGHKNVCYNLDHKSYNLKVYKIIRENGGWLNWSMIEIEKYPCNDKNEACARERYWYELLNANMNSVCPTFKVEKRKEYEKEYYEKYYEQNVHKILKYNKEYRDNNKDKINEKHHCQCGGFYTNSNKAQHIKSKKHQNFMKTLNENI